MPATVSFSFVEKDIKHLAYELNKQTIIARKLMGSGNKPPLQVIEDIINSVEVLYTKKNDDWRERVLFRLGKLKLNREKQIKESYDKFVAIAEKVVEVARFIDIYKFQLEPSFNVYMQKLLRSNANTLNRLQNIGHVGYVLGNKIKDFKFGKQKEKHKTLLDNFIAKFETKNVALLLEELPNYEKAKINGFDLRDAQRDVSAVREVIKEKLELIHDERAVLMGKAAPKSGNILSTMPEKIRGQYGDDEKPTAEKLWEFIKETVELDSKLMKFSGFITELKKNEEELQKMEKKYLADCANAMNNIPTLFKQDINKLHKDLLNSIQWLRNKGDELYIREEVSYHRSYSYSSMFGDKKPEPKKRDMNVEISNHLSKYLNRFAEKLESEVLTKSFNNIDIKTINYLSIRAAMNLAARNAHESSVEDYEYTPRLKVKEFTITAKEGSKFAGKSLVANGGNCKVFGAYILPHIPESHYNELDFPYETYVRAHLFRAEIYAPFTRDYVSNSNLPLEVDMIMFEYDFETLEKFNNKGIKPGFAKCDIGLLGNNKAHMLLHLNNEGTEKSRYII